MLGPWFGMCVLIIKKQTYNFYLVIEVPDHVYVLVGIISRSPKSLQETTIALDRAARRMGLEINQAKPKYMICGTKKKYVENVYKAKHMTFERVNSFVYLGTLITTDNNTSAEINP